MAVEIGGRRHDIMPFAVVKENFVEFVKEAEENPTKLKALNDCVGRRKLLNLSVNSDYRLIRSGAYWLHERKERRIVRRQERDPQYQAEYAYVEGLVEDVRKVWFNYFRFFGFRESVAETQALKHSTIDVVREKKEIMKARHQTPTIPSAK